MRILYVHRGYFPLLAGAERMAECLAATMRTRAHDVTILCRSSGDSVERHLLDSGVEILGTPSLAPAALRSLLGGRPDVVHAVDLVWPEYASAALDLARQWEAPFAVTPASAAPTWRDQTMAAAVCRAADRVFALTCAERDELIRRGVKESRLVVIGQGPYPTSPADPTHFRQMYGITGPLILFVGRKMRSKGYVDLLAATTEVWRDYPTAHFVFLGPRWDPDCVDIFAAHVDPRITEVDMVDERQKHSALAASDVLCLPSTVDSFPLVYLEAWSHAKPVIASTFPGSAEIVRHGENGLIVAPSSTAIAAGLRTLLADEAGRRSMGRRGLESVRSRFNWDVVTDRIEASYYEIVTTRSV